MLPVADTDVLQDLPQSGKVGRGFARTSEVGLADDLHEGHARAVEIDVTQVGIVTGFVMDRLAGFFLEMDPPKPDETGSIFPLRFSMPPYREMGFARPVVLRDLVALGQVRIEVILAGKGTGFGNVTLNGQRHANGVFDGAAVQYGQDAGHAQADGTHAGIGLPTEGHGASTEDLRVRQELGRALPARLLLR